jgi:hypothetical protein
MPRYPQCGVTSVDILLRAVDLLLDEMQVQDRMGPILGT